MSIRRNDSHDLPSLYQAEAEALRQPETLTNFIQCLIIQNLLHTTNGTQLFEKEA